MAGIGRMRWPVWVTLVAAVTALTAAAAASAAGRGGGFAALANRCFAVTGGGLAHERLFVKPTGVGTVMLYDGARLLRPEPDGSLGRTSTPGKASEWSVRPARGDSVALRAVDGGRDFGRFTFTRASGCKPYPEAGVNATGRTRSGKRRDGTVFGFADAHLHVTADLRAGGAVIYGENFDPFGITEALGHDEDEHGPNGTKDVTGNLLRSGSPVGTHDTHGWPTFAGWPVFDTYTHQQTYYRWLERAWLSGERLIVAQTVEDEPLCNIEPVRTHSCDETDSVELQVKRLRALQDYVDAQKGGRGRGWFRIVETPAQARHVIEHGKLAVVIGIEWSDPFGCSERLGQPNCTRADIDRGIARIKALGIRALFVAHWVDNALAGAALEGGSTGDFISAMELEQTGHPFATGACPFPEQGVEVPPLPGRQCNAKGLTDLGEYAIGKLIDNHMLIEADHLSEHAREQVLAIAEKRHYPLVSSHTNTGGLWVPQDLKRLYALGGYATATIDDIATVAHEILEFHQYGFDAGIGSDTGGFNALPAPDGGGKQGFFKYPFRSYHCGVVLDREQTGERTYDINKDGVAHYGLVPDLLADVQRRPGGRDAIAILSHSAERYLETWARTGA